jgi:pimeloyl-ACP methyl ester carboxylesterase
VSAEEYPPELAKFKSTLLLLHGVWSGAWCWLSWATHFSNLGWNAIAVDLRRRSKENPSGQLKGLSLSDCVRDLGEVIRSLSEPPVVLAMNLGALVALKALEKSKLAALVLVSPTPPKNIAVAPSRAQRLLWLKYRWLILLHKPFAIDEKDFHAYFLTPLSVNLQRTLSRQIVPDASALVREFLAPRVSIASRPWSCPILVLAGSDDRITPPATSRQIASSLSAEFEECSGQGHWLIEHDGENIVRNIHRWIIQKLGEKILLTQLS